MGPAALAEGREEEFAILLSGRDFEALRGEKKSEEINDWFWCRKILKKLPK